MKAADVETGSVDDEFDAAADRVRSVPGDVTARLDAAGADAGPVDCLGLSKRAAATQFELAAGVRALREEESPAIASDIGRIGLRGGESEHGNA